MRTLLEHAWAGFSHDRVYKSAFVVPQKWQRELAGVAAMLEQADEAFSRVEQGLQRYAASYGDYMTEEQMRAEMELLENVLACAPDNPELAHRIGKLAMTLGDWSKAVAVLEPHVGSNRRPIWRDLGVSSLQAAQKGNRIAPSIGAVRRIWSRRSIPRSPTRTRLASLAGTWKDLDPEKARDLYKQAYEVAPSDPYAVGNYLAAEIMYRRDLSAVPLMAPAIAAAMRTLPGPGRGRDEPAVGLLRPGHLPPGAESTPESLAAYAKAIQLSPAGWYLETSLKTLTQLKVAARQVERIRMGHPTAAHRAGRQVRAASVPACRCGGGLARRCNTDRGRW